MAERPIGIGDWAIIHRGTTSKEYVIVDIDTDNNILIETSEGVKTIRYIDDEWRVVEYGDDHWIEFTEPRSGLSEVEEMTMQIMVNLPLESIENLCRTSREYRMICAKDHFWKLKFVTDYGYEPKNIDSWESLYKTHGDVYKLEMTGPDIPIQIKGLKGTYCAAGWNVGFIINENHDVWAFGDNRYGQLGIGNNLSTATPVLIKNLQARQVAVGYRFTVFLDLSGKVWITGMTDDPRTGVARYIPEQIESVKHISFVKIMANAYRIWMIDIDNNMWTFMIGGIPPYLSIDLRDPQIHTERKVKDVVFYSDSAMLIDMDDNVWVRGDNKWGQLGLPPGGYITEYRKLPGIKAKKISMGRGLSSNTDTDTIVTAIIDLDDNLWLAGYKGARYRPLTALEISEGIRGRNIKGVMSIFEQFDPSLKIIQGIKARDVGISSRSYVLDLDGNVWKLGRKEKEPFMSKINNIKARLMSVSYATVLFIV